MDSILAVAPLWGYFDPGSGSLVLQAIVGGSAGLAVLARYLWNCVPSFLGRRRGAASEITSSK